MFCAVAVGRPSRMWEMLLTKHCACSANAAESGRPEEGRQAERQPAEEGEEEHRDLHALPEAVLRLVDVAGTTSSGALPACQSQRRCAHQKPPMHGLEMSSGVSTAW